MRKRIGDLGLIMTIAEVSLSSLSGLLSLNFLCHVSRKDWNSPTCCFGIFSVTQRFGTFHRHSDEAWEDGLSQSNNLADPDLLGLF